MNSVEIKNMITWALSMGIIEGKMKGGLSNLLENKYIETSGKSPCSLLYPAGVDPINHQGTGDQHSEVFCITAKDKEA